jgi:hypothetical protein
VIKIIELRYFKWLLFRLWSTLKYHIRQ